VINLPTIGLLSAQIGLGIFIYWGLCSVFKVAAYQDIMNILIKRKVV